jgi:hypothetical protein
VLRHEKQEYYANLIEGEWYWINGCYECCGEKRDWMCYSVCNEHDVCRTCGRHNSNPEVKTRWGGKEGWQCNICHDTEKEKEQAKWKAKIEDDYCEWDFEGKDSVTCPWCTYEWDYYDSYSNHCDSDDEEVVCEMCDNKFSVTGVQSITFNTERISR